jgi:putative ABC transport system substrate-binding protein
MRRREFISLLGLTAAWPLTARAQQQAPVLGYLSGGGPTFSARYAAAFRQGLADAGYIEGKTVTTEYRWAEGHYDRLPALAADLVGRKVDLIAASGGDLAAQAAKEASTTIPIVFCAGGDPVATGLVDNLARPGGNVTGVSFMTAELSSKRLEILSEVVPEAKIIGLLVNPKNATTDRVIRDLRDAAHAIQVQLQVVRASTSAEIAAAFHTLVKVGAQAVVVDPDHFIDSQRDQLVSLAARAQLPAIYGLRELPAAGGLMSYGVSLTSVYRQFGGYAGRVLKGAQPADLPVERAAQFELVINLATAQALGLTISPTLLARAGEVIE